MHITQQYPATVSAAHCYMEPFRVGRLKTPPRPKPSLHGVKVHGLIRTPLMSRFVSAVWKLPVTGDQGAGHCKGVEKKADSPAKSFLKTSVAVVVLLVLPVWVVCFWMGCWSRSLWGQVSVFNQDYCFFESNILCFQAHLQHWSIKTHLCSDLHWFRFWANKMPDMMMMMSLLSDRWAHFHHVISSKHINLSLWQIHIARLK